jgi:hypothetical protein
MSILNIFKRKKQVETVELKPIRLRISKTIYPNGKKQFGHNSEWYGLTQNKTKL